MPFTIGQLVFKALEEKCKGVGDLPSHIPAELTRVVVWEQRKGVGAYLCHRGGGEEL